MTYSDSLQKHNYTEGAFPMTTFTDLMDTATAIRNTPNEDISADQRTVFQNEIQNTYRFFIANPHHTPGVNYSFWIRDDNMDFPVIESNTGGFTTFNSRDTGIGDGIEPTREFIDLVGIGFHEAMCFTPATYFANDSDHFHTTVDMVYDGSVREYEAWCASELVKHMVIGNNTSIPELAPLYVWSDIHTEFGCPALTDNLFDQ